MTKLIIKKKDFITPFGEIIAGNTIRGELYEFTYNEILHAKNEGFFHLVDGTFLCYIIDGKKQFCCLESIDNVTLEDGTPVELVYTGQGNKFEVKVIV